MTGTLYVVATPIGNLEDLSPRAVEVLRTADLIAAEDTRVFAALARALDIDAGAVSYHKFNEKKTADRLVDALLAGKDVALVSDAGTPCISDPGHILVACAAQEGISISPIPGASAVPAALSISGFDGSNYTFHGFFPRKGQEGTLDELAQATCRVHVFYESPRRIVATIEAIEAYFPAASICLCNDLTKLHQRIYRGTPAQVLAELLDNPAREKGEYALVLSLPPKARRQEGGLSPEALLVDLWVKEGCSIKEAVALAAQKHGLQKKELYSASLRLKERLL